jgi:hypothetical protein
MNKLTIIFLAFISLYLTSCYTTAYTYNGNVLDNVIGSNKNEILRTLGVPERSMDDGKGGTILIYEQFSQTTISNANIRSYAKGSTSGLLIYGYGSARGVSSTQARQTTYASSYSETTNSKSYRNIFLNQNNIAYDFQTNFGAKYNSYRCLDKTKTWLCAACFLPVVSVPVAIISINKAKKNGEICD